LAGFCGAALGLELAELLEGSFEWAREARAVQAERRERADLLTQRFDDDERRVGFGKPRL